MKILLFDIDSTLIESGNKAHGLSYNYAINKVCKGIKKNKKLINIHGMVDPQIILEILKQYGFNEDKAKTKIKIAIRAMEKYYFSHLREGKYLLCPGVKRLLIKLKQKNIFCTVMTGNLQSIGWHKIERSGIKNFFRFGVFGDKALKRSDLIRTAINSVATILNKEVSIEDFIIVGDTPLDVFYAKEAGTKIIAVAQGKYSRKQLEQAGADLTLDSLEEIDKFLKFIEN